MTDTETPAPALPVFYKSPAALSPERHATAGLRQPRHFRFARGSNAVLLTVSELAMAARHYVIAFTAGDRALPMAVLGLGDDDNVFVNAEGRWREDAYVPAYVRRYPFIFVSGADDPDRLVLCVDEAAEDFEQESERPFFRDGKPGPEVRDVLRFCEGYQAQYEETLRFGEWLHQHALLEDKVARAELPDGRVLTLSGFRAISPEKLRALDASQVLELHGKGWLPLLHFHLQSLSNLAVLSRLTQRRGGEAS